MNKQSKSKERLCLDKVIRLKNYNELIGTIVETERPDFIIGDTGIEHFMIDVITNKKESIHRKQSQEMLGKVKYYQNNEEKLDKDIRNGTLSKYIDETINNRIWGISKFEYSKFISNFKRVYNKHYHNINEYRKHCNKLGFLIEIPYMKDIGQPGYIITNKGKQRFQRLRTIPITRDMIKCFKYIGNVDFIIICMEELAFEENIPNYKHNCIFKIDMKNVEKSIREQSIIICDKFDYPNKFKNKDVFHLIIRDKEGNKIC